jgi:hypothetical protein
MEGAETFGIIVIAPRVAGESNWDTPVAADLLELASDFEPISTVFNPPPTLTTWARA